MSLQTVYNALNQLAQQGKLTMAAIQGKVRQVGWLISAVPTMDAVQVSSATVTLSGSGASQQLDISAQVTWRVFHNVPATLTITQDPTAHDQLQAVFECKLGSVSGLEIPGIDWFTFSNTSLGGETNPWVPVQMGLANAADAFFATTLLIKGDTSQTQIPIRIISDGSGGITTTLNASPVDLPSITDILAAFGSNTSGINLPAGLDSLDHLSLLELSVGFTPSSTVSQISVMIGKSPQAKNGWDIIPGVFTLYSYAIGLTIVNPLTSATRQVGGQIQTTVRLGSVDITVAAVHPASDGWQFAGTLGKDNLVPIGTLLSGLASQFNVYLPPVLNEFTLSDFELQFDTATHNASGTFAVNFCVNKTPIDLQVTATLTKGSQNYSVTVVGQLTIDTAVFDVTFTSQTDKTFLATWSDPVNPLEFKKIASAFGWTNVPSIPSDLDLKLTSAGFIYDFTTGNLIFGAQSKNYGTLCFAAISASGYQFDVMLSVDKEKEFSLSNLPVVGETLASIENIEVGQLMVLICSQAPSSNVITTINGLITTLNTQGGMSIPRFPTTLITGNVVLQASLQFGSQTIPLNLQLGGSGNQQASPPALAAPATAASTTALVADPGSSQSGGVTTSSSPGGVTWFNVQKSFGPVTFQRIGAMYQSDQQTLWFEIDATLALGPLTVDLVGLGLGSPIRTFEPQFSIQGLGISYANPPLTIAGSLVNLSAPGGPAQFAGGLTVGASDFQITAFGYYGKQVDPTTKRTFTSLFIFGDLAYDFGGPPAFFVTGVALGFGYNSGLRMPTIDQVAGFPFVQVLPTSTTPNPGLFPNNDPQTVMGEILNTTSPWVAPTQGSLWFAAGITFTSFEMVNSQALVMVEIGQQLVIELIGISRAQFPQSVAGSSEPVYAYIELDLEIEFAPTLGVFSVQAVLAQSSFLLDKACVLTGGFAFFVWYGNNEHAGDFVLSLGGYNSGFVAPSYYPSVPRVGFHWSLDSSITVSGGAYFAFTPSVLMVGGELNATYQSGNLKAWFDVHADIIVQWKPFWFDADFGLTIGASYRVDLLFTSFTVSVELGCSLELWGPPTGGTVRVDWYIISFSIGFGASKSASQPVLQGWSDVQAMLPNTGSADTPNVLKLSPVSGLTPQTTSPPTGTQERAPAAAQAASAAWVVRGSQFGFTTSSSVPASTATVGGSHSFNGMAFNVAPLGWSGVEASHAVTIVDCGNKDVSDAFSVAPVRGSVPAQLWGTQPLGTPSGDSQLVADQLLGLSVLVHPPQIGGSAGPVDVQLNLSSTDIQRPNAVIGVCVTAQPQGDVAVNSPTTIAVIANPLTGIGSPTAVSAREAIFTALQHVGYAPQTTNNPMTQFGARSGCALSAEPLLVE